MTRILALADEVDDALGVETLQRLEPDLVVGCGDLPAEHLEYVVTVTGAPLLYVPGNHDPDYRARRSQTWAIPVVAGASGRPEAVGLAVSAPAGPEPPGGCTNVDGRVVRVGDLVVAGLGGSHRYREGPNQYTQREMRRRARRLARRVAFRGPRRVDVLVTHAPPLGLGDDSDPCHQGFAAFHDLVERLRPKLLLHGHIHPYGQDRPDRWIGDTRVVNVIPHRVLELEP